MQNIVGRIYCIRLMVFVCVCVFCERTIIFFAKGVGGFNMSRPRGPWFLNPSMRRGGRKKKEELCFFFAGQSFFWAPFYISNQYFAHPLRKPNTATCQQVS